LNLLLDTHVALWAIVDAPRLPERIRGLISDPDNAITVSTVSLWEIAIKHGLARRGVGAMPVSAGDALGHFRRAGYAMLAVTPDHAAFVETLPPLHADPFDRLLIAQAFAEPLRLVTHDRAVAVYGESIILF
jgi:PIN domain nuclease of toxin-antitoxin system